MKFNKNTKLVEIEAYAEAYYSDQYAYGLLYLPVNLYERYEDDLAKLSFGVHDLDGMHSYVEGDIVKSEKTLSEAVQKMVDSKLEDEFDEHLAEDVAQIINVNYIEIIKLQRKIKKFAEKEEVEVKLEEDLSVNDVLIPKGTLITYKKQVHPLPDSHEVLFETNIEI